MTMTKEYDKVWGLVNYSKFDLLCPRFLEFPFPTVAPTPAPPRTKHKLVAEGKKLTFRCGKKIASKKGKI